jgi:hypothetical protein
MNKIVAKVLSLKHAKGRDFCVNKSTARFFPREYHEKFCHLSQQAFAMDLRAFFSISSPENNDR